ncbi:hypothetical protein [Deinococcus arenicola]|uniref:Uncharacterized protein n=1 Tax=Deinococcus arenicola TaxID=2994950 RepID=A0ABU4DSF6_9DEIO|nr:hypothetical protein [Deinococcus sp. ZS9-10]MDV6375355.1 hypothetical protein [Deinococcus sp. ZS9-10]
MTLNTRSAPTFRHPQMHAPQPARALTPPRVLLLEALTPVEDQTLPALSGWELHVWPVARLGDVTVEARPLRPDLGPDDLRVALQNVGWTPLGRVWAQRN